MSFAIKPEYTPMSFKDMALPYEVYKEEQKRQEDAYYSLLENMRSLDDLKDSQVDRDTYDSYVNFKNQINDIADSIATNGLTVNSRNDLIGFRNRYQNEFANIVDQIKRRGELVKEQREYQQKYPNSFFDIDYTNVPVSSVGANSTYASYNMDNAATEVANNIYNLYANSSGNVSQNDAETVLQPIRDRYNYDNLNDNQKSLVDNAIISGIMTGQQAYQKQQLAQINAEYDRQLKQARLMNELNKRNGRVGSKAGNGGVGGVINPQLGTASASGDTDYGWSGDGKTWTGPLLKDGKTFTAKLYSGTVGDPESVYTFKLPDGSSYNIKLKDFAEDEGQLKLIKKIYGGTPIEADVLTYGVKISPILDDNNVVVGVIDKDGNAVPVKSKNKDDMYKAYVGKDGELPVAARKIALDKNKKSEADKINTVKVVSTNGKPIDISQFNKNAAKGKFSVEPYVFENIDNIKDYNYDRLSREQFTLSFANYLNSMTGIDTNDILAYLKYDDSEGAATAENGLKKFFSQGFKVTCTKLMRNGLVDAYKYSIINESEQIKQEEDKPTKNGGQDKQEQQNKQEQPANQTTITEDTPYDD